jgi:hypothetical protein
MTAAHWPCGPEGTRCAPGATGPAWLSYLRGER